MGDRLRLKLKEKMNSQLLIKLAILLLIVRLIINIIDFEKEKKYFIESGTWQVLIIGQTTLLRLCIELYFYNCKIDTMF